ncbi:MAG: biopolymer transporter ExbD [Lentisphaerae bacterium]|nr:biopolymer transporter ExbD [Lentisphaerota bacterium]
MKFGREADEAIEMNMTPMIDCIFQLILFFLVTSSFIKLEQDLSINLPVQSREMKVPPPPARPIIVNVKYLGANRVDYVVENESMPLQALTANFSRARARNKDQAVIIRGDRRVRWDHIAAVMGSCAHAGIVKISASMEINEGR